VGVNRGEIWWADVGQPFGSEPGNVLCRPRETGLEKASVANVSQLTVVDRGRLAEKAGVLSARLLTQVEDGVRLEGTIMPGKLLYNSSV